MTIIDEILSFVITHVFLFHNIHAEYKFKRSILTGANIGLNNLFELRNIPQKLFFFLSCHVRLVSPLMPFIFSSMQSTSRVGRKKRILASKNSAPFCATVCSWRNASLKTYLRKTQVAKVTSHVDRFTNVIVSILRDQLPARIYILCK